MRLLPQFLRMFFALCIIVSPAFVSANWTKLTSPTSEDLNKILFVDDRHGWIVGEGGTILRTTDGGDSWESLNSGISFNIVGISFIDSLTGWVIGWKNDAPPIGTLLLSTIDGGETWSQQLFPQENQILFDIYFFDAINGWVSGRNGTIASTIDSGIKWNYSRLDPSLFQFFPVRCLKFYNTKYGFASGGIIDNAGMIWRSLDYGQNWDVTPIGPEPIYDIHILDSLNILAVGGDFEYGAMVARSSNGGDNWEYITLAGINARGTATAVDFRTDSEAWATVGTSEKYIISPDSGITWQSFDTPDSTNLFDIIFMDSLTAFAVGIGGVIYRYDHPVVGISGNPANVPANLRLAQNYPNPFNPQTTILFELETSAHIRLTVFDAAGKHVRSLIDAPQIPGEHRVFFDGSNLASGVYFYHISAISSATRQPAFSQTRKMLLLK